MGLQGGRSGLSCDWVAGCWVFWAGVAAEGRQEEGGGQAGSGAVNQDLQ